MGLKNHLIAEDSAQDCAMSEIDIQFSFGEVREYFYKVGDSVYFKTGDIRSPRSTVVPGIAIIGNDSSRIADMGERYFGIVVVDGIIVSYFPTTKADYESMENQA